MRLRGNATLGLWHRLSAFRSGHLPATLPTATLPAEVVRALSQAEHTALRELIKAHTAHGNVARASALKEVYRRQLGALKTAVGRVAGKS